MAQTCDGTAGVDVLMRVGLPLPLGMVGFLLQTLGQAYPGTMIGTGDTSHMVIRIPAGSRMDSVEPVISAEDIAAAKAESPDMEMFLTSIRDANTVGVSVPDWLSALLTSASEGILEASGAPNYLSIEVKSERSKPFAWIVCRPGTPSPHEFRQRAEARVAALEAQLRGAGIEPGPDGDDLCH